MEEEVRARGLSLEAFLEDFPQWGKPLTCDCEVRSARSENVAAVPRCRCAAVAANSSFSTRPNHLQIANCNYPVPLPRYTLLHLPMRPRCQGDMSSTLH